MKVRALIVEDNENDAWALTRLLQKSELDVTSKRVETPEDYRNCLLNESWDVILSDFNIPGFGGKEALGILKSLNIDIPFVLISGIIGDEAAVSMMKGGASDYLMKDNLSRLPLVIRREIEECANRKQKIALQQKAEKLSQIIESSPELIFTFDSTEKLIYLNHSALNFFYEQNSERQSQFLKTILTSESYEYFKAVIEADIISKGNWEGELNLQKQNNSSLPFLISMVSHNHDGITEYSIMAMDISERKSFEIEIVNLNNSLEYKISRRTAELVASNQELESKNLEIINSIQYASKIQKAILTKPEELSLVFPDSFVVEKPRDLVSGDFFWMYKKDTDKYVTVADCTGHGVPGALLSIVGHRMLNKIVLELRMQNPSDVLEFLDYEFNKMFQQSKDEKYNISDAMDISFCRIDEKEKKIYYAGAYSPILIVSRGKIEEISATKRPIGHYFSNRFKSNFAEVEFNYLPGDRLFLFSDGFQSQFGGQQGKKINKNRFKELLLKTSLLPISEQKLEVRNYFNEWKGNNDQVDDVCVMGIVLN